jgi:hypothetical protein
VTYLLYGVLVGVIIYQGIIGYLNKRELIELVKNSHDLLEEGMDKWHTERQQLLDRIQAPTFAEYKTQEVRIIKAQNGEKEPPKLEQL